MTITINPPVRRLPTSYVEVDVSPRGAGGFIAPADSTPDGREAVGSKLVHRRSGPTGTQKPRNPRPGVVYTDAEMQAILGACGRGLLGARLRTLIWVGWRAGLRLAEATALLVGDVDLESGTIQVRRGKGCKSRNIPIDGQTAEVIRGWLAVRPEGGQHVFNSVRVTGRGHLTSQWVQRKMTELGRKAGIQKRVHYHSLRHTYAVNLSRLPGARMVHVMQALGHSRLSATDTYLGHLDPQGLRELVQGAA